MIRGIHGDRARYKSTYFAPYQGYFYTGDGARRDEDGYYWITGACHARNGGSRLQMSSFMGALLYMPAPDVWPAFHAFQLRIAVQVVSTM
jgi:non-ribosomal peptide synthetase component E (peptide arylation enzyme)